MWLKAHPGDYETVRRMLGHRNIQTTINFYCGLETLQANKMFGDLVRKLMKFGLSSAMPETTNKPMLPPEPKSASRKVRSLLLAQWPEADRAAWAAACRPAERLKRGGTASHMNEDTQRDLARRYGYFLDYVERSEGLADHAEAAGYVTPDRVEGFLAELTARVSSETVYGSIRKLRRTAQLLAPGRDFTWLSEIEKDLALVKQPKSKFDRLVYTNILAEAGMTLMAEAATHRSPVARVRQFRNGLMVALKALHPIRLKNFAALEIGRSFKKVNNPWWIVLSASETKEKRPDERPVDPCLIRWIERYLNFHRPVLARTGVAPAALWLSSNDGRAMTYLAVERVIKETTLTTVGVDVSPHLFRAAGASTAAVHAPTIPHLGSALLHHIDPAVVDEHYNRASSLSATQAYAALVRALWDD
jgi:integrase